MIDTLVVLAKRPAPGLVKTRLMPAVSAGAAAGLAAACLTDTLDRAEQVPAGWRVLAFDGDPTGWVRPGWRIAAQPGGSLDERICAGFDEAGAGSAILVGMDTPQLRAAQLAVFDTDRFDCCLGPAADGGYWAIGFRDARRARSAIAGVAMSSADTARQQLERLRQLRLEVQVLAELVDVDTIEDAATVAAVDPTTAFAARFRRLHPSALAGAA
jgi:hypothetical protein